MSMKKIALGIGAIIFTAVLSAVLVVGGNSYLSAAKGQQHEASAGKPAEKSAGFLGLFGSSEKPIDVQFVEIKNIIITLNGDNGDDRYMQLELALTTNGDEETKKAQTMVPAIQGATVNLLSNKSYSAIRAMTTEELSSQLMNEYKKTLEGLKVDMPFSNVVISRLVFQ